MLGNKSRSLADITPKNDNLPIVLAVNSNKKCLHHLNFLPELLRFVKAFFEIKCNWYCVILKI